ncbi:uncharacterized protein BJX67DRAFT_367788 [Aspergillus lucknowensis]|uniref:HTH CENPB-type domain-containing protein n=1 Tax=Aspergillus lucknowensis TaxID=176173 RepID=A0ABR4L8I8_9EURO
MLDIIPMNAVVDTVMTINRSSVLLTELQTMIGTGRRIAISRPRSARASRIVSRSEGINTFESSDRWLHRFLYNLTQYRTNLSSIQLSISSNVLSVGVNMAIRSWLSRNSASSRAMQPLPLSQFRRLATALGEACSNCITEHFLLKNCLTMCSFKYPTS